LCAWTRGLTADVDQGRALGHHRECMVDGLGQLEKAATIGEGIAGTVEHAHDDRRVECQAPVGVR